MNSTFIQIQPDDKKVSLPAQLFIENNSIVFLVDIGTSTIRFEKTEYGYCGMLHADSLTAERVDICLPVCEAIENSLISQVSR